MRKNDIFILIASAIGFAVGAALTNDLKNKQIIELERINTRRENAAHDESFKSGWDAGVKYAESEARIEAARKPKTDPNT